MMRERDVIGRGGGDLKEGFNKSDMFGLKATRQEETLSYFLVPKCFVFFLNFVWVVARSVSILHRRPIILHFLFSVANR